MNMNSTEMAYRKTAVEGASGFGLLIALYDTLAGDLKRATEAQRNNDIETRCKEVNHALLVVGYLEDWIDREDGGELAQKLIAFYSTMRSKLIEAQAMQSCEILEQQMALVLSIRGTWQDLELRAASTLQPPSPAPSPQTPKYPGTVSPHENQKVSSWSA
jgi:flagellar secretion chaperone FliS